MSFLVWKRGPHGRGIASLDTFDPRKMSDWKSMEAITLQILPLVAPYDTMSLDSLVVCFPCPAYEVLP